MTVRSRWIAGGVGVILAVGAAVAAAAAAGGIADDGAPPAALPSPTAAVPSPSASGDAAQVEQPSTATVLASDAPCLADLPQPTWLPEEVIGVSVQCQEDLAAELRAEIGPQAAPPEDVAHYGIVLSYQLSGQASADSPPTDIPMDQWSDEDIDSGVIDSATAIMLTIYPGTDQTDAAPGGPGLTDSTVTLDNGLPARLIQGDNGYGTVRLEWTDGDNSYLIITSTSSPAHGTSGPTVDELLTMAGSI